MLDGARSLRSPIGPTKSDPAGQKPRWHYVNFAEGTKDYVPARDCAEIPGQGDCVISAIDRAVADLTRDNANQISA